MPDEPDYSDTLKFALSLRDDEDDLVCCNCGEPAREPGRPRRTAGRLPLPCG